jgi:hypothetical protein
LTLFETLPPLHKTFLVSDDSSTPHLKEREYAVIDTTDRELQTGELFLIQYTFSREIMQATESLCQISADGPEEPVWWLRDLAGFRRIHDCRAGMPTFAGLSDGPYLAADLQRKLLLGRVVGFAKQSFGEALLAVRS